MFHTGANLGCFPACLLSLISMSFFFNLYAYIYIIRMVLLSFVWVDTGWAYVPFKGLYWCLSKTHPKPILNLPQIYDLWYKRNDINIYICIYIYIYMGSRSLMPCHAARPIFFCQDLLHTFRLV